jgi:hypothetical protein
MNKGSKRELVNHDQNSNLIDEEYKLSYRSNKNKDGASSRREPSSGRLIDQIKTHPNEIISGRPRTASEGNIAIAGVSSSDDFSD